MSSPPLAPPPPSLSKGMTALLTSPAPWNKILFSASFFLVTLNDANIPDTQTEAVPNETSKPGHQRISSFVFHFYSKSLSRATEKSGKKRESEFIFTQDYKTNWCSKTSNDVKGHPTCTYIMNHEGTCILWNKLIITWTCGEKWIWEMIITVLTATKADSLLWIADLKKFRQILATTYV